MSQRGQLLVVALHAVLGVSVLAAATVLTALHDPITGTMGSLFGIILGLAGAGSAAVAALGTVVNGKSVVTQASLDQSASVLAATIGSLAGARAQIDGSTVAGGRRAVDPPAAVAPQPAQQPPL